MKNDELSKFSKAYTHNEISPTIIFFDEILYYAFWKELPWWVLCSPSLLIHGIKNELIYWTREMNYCKFDGMVTWIKSKQPFSIEIYGISWQLFVKTFRRFKLQLPYNFTYYISIARFEFCMWTSCCFRTNLRLRLDDSHYELKDDWWLHIRYLKRVQCGFMYIYVIFYWYQRFIIETEVNIVVTIMEMMNIHA